MMKRTLLALTAALLINPAFAATTSAPAAQAPTATPTQDQAQQEATANPQQERIKKLSYDAQNIKLPAEERADALRQLSRYPNQNALIAVARALKDEDAIVREAAVVGAEPYKIEHRWKMVSPLLTDDVEQVRITAAMNLVRDYSTLEAKQQEMLEKPVAELIAHLKTREDAPSQLLLADTYRWHKEWDTADKMYQDLLAKDNKNPQIWLNYADNERAQENDQKAIDILDDAIKLLPENADLHYSKSLALVRLKEKKKAAAEIKTAANLAKDNSYYWYLNGVMQEDFDLTDSTKSFEQAYMISGAPEQLYAVCDIYARYNNPKTDECLEELAKYAPPYVIDKLKKTAETVKASTAN